MINARVETGTKYSEGPKNDMTMRSFPFEQSRESLIVSKVKSTGQCFKQNPSWHSLLIALSVRVQLKEQNLLVSVSFREQRKVFHYILEGFASCQVPCFSCPLSLAFHYFHLYGLAADSQMALWSRSLQRTWMP